MTGEQLDRFFHEVIHQGAHALLPQNLSEEWLSTLLHEADLWQHGHQEPGQKVPGLLAAVLTILDEQQGRPMRTIGSLSVSSSQLLACMSHYALCLAVEQTSRASGAAYALPTVATIFDERRYAHQ